MKRANNLYQHLCNLDNIMSAYKTVKKNTKNKLKIQNFEDYLSINLSNLYTSLINKTYIPGKYNIFLIKSPKQRIIMSQQIMDKIVNQLVFTHILSILDKYFIDTNVATRKNKGTSYGINKTYHYLTKFPFKFYILKFDITKYFYNIDHNIVKELLLSKIKDQDSLNLLFLMIDSTDKSYVNTKITSLNGYLYKKGKGISIGNVVCQTIGILYLNELDHYIKEQLHIKYYIRYMDDGILFHESKEYLQYCLKEITKIVLKYKLELNSKTMIISSNCGFNFLGYHFYITDKVHYQVINKNRHRIAKKLKKLKLLNYEVYSKSLISYRGYLKNFK